MLLIVTRTMDLIRSFVSGEGGRLKSSKPMQMLTQIARCIPNNIKGGKNYIFNLYTPNRMAKVKRLKHQALTKM